MQAEGLVLSEQPVQDTVLNGRILIADDDFDFRGILVRRASQLGLSVVEVEDGQQAMDAVTTEKFDIILVDLHMPKHNGLEVVQAVREVDPNIQAIILTGGATVETAIEALRTGVYDYLTKPLETLADLDIALTRALEHRRLIEENERLFAEVQRLAVTDPLTGLYNRRKLDELLATEIERAMRYDRPLSIIMIDLDDLKRINDSYGHPQGDEVLKLVAEAIRTQIRSVDLGTRFGGDEFVILLPEAELEAARMVGKRICEKITSTIFRGEQLSVSAGVAQWMHEYTSPEHFLEAVDQAMYQAKRAGGKRICLLGA
jgi:two-component system cell cycle response regulator